jgi:hypothetical protein
MRPGATAPPPAAPPPEESERASVAGAIYGSILVTAVIAGFSEHHAPASEIFASVVATSVVFWLAHVYAEALATSATGGRALSLHLIRVLMAQEWPLVEAAALPLVPLTAAWIGLISTDTGVSIALGLGVFDLFAWGFNLGRRRGARLPLVSGLFAAALGLVVVALKVAVH